MPKPEGDIGAQYIVPYTVSSPFQGMRENHREMGVAYKICMPHPFLGSIPRPRAGQGLRLEKYGTQIYLQTEVSVIQPNSS